MPKYTHFDISIAAKKIIGAFKSPSGGFKGFIIVGKPGEGKSVYALKMMRDILMALNPKLTETEAYLLALQYFYFKVSPFLECVRDKQREVENALPKIDWTQRIPVMALDDASLYAGTDLYFEDQAMYSAFQKTMTTIRTATSGILITAPAVGSLTKCLRDYYNYFVVEISKLDDKWDRLAKIQEWRKIKGRLRLVENDDGSDEFTCHVQNEIYAKYLKPRIQMGADAVDEALASSREKSKVLQSTTTKVLPQLPLPETIKKARKKHHKIPLYSPKALPPRSPIVDEIARRAGMSREEYIRMLDKRKVELSNI